MPERDKLNPRQERFARGYVEHGIARRAYVEAGYRSAFNDPAIANAADTNASRLIRNDKVEKRIQHLRQAMGKRADITEDSIADELEQARVGAMQCEQHAAAVQAVIAKAKLAGLMIDKKEIRRGDIESMSEQELRDYLATPTQQDQSVQGNEAAPIPNAPTTDSRN